MKILYIAPINENGYPVANKIGDKKLQAILKENFNSQKVIWLHRSPSRKSHEDLYSHRVIFLDDEDANFLLLTINKKEFKIRELPEQNYTIL